MQNVQLSLAIKKSLISICRCAPITTSCAILGQARTYESKPVPGSFDYYYPNAWAQRLFELKEISKKGEQLKDADKSEEPPLLNMICRVKPLNKLPYYQIAMLTKYGIGHEKKNHQWAIVKNVPSVCEDLKKIAHLIRVQPLRLPHGLPSSPRDYLYCQLNKETGELKLHRGRTAAPAEDVTQQQHQQKQQLEEDEAKADTRTNEAGNSQSQSQPYTLNESEEKALTTQLELPIKQCEKRHDTQYYRKFYGQQWQTYRLHHEYYSYHYTYKLNQDGKEYRPNKLWRLDNAMRQTVNRSTNPDGTLRPNQTFEADWNHLPWRFI